MGRSCFVLATSDSIPCTVSGRYKIGYIKYRKIGYNYLVTGIAKKKYFPH